MRTTETYNYNTTHFIQYLDEFHEVNEIEDVSTVHVKKYIQHQLNLGKKATYINTVIKSLRSFYTYLVAEEYVTLNIMARTESLCDERYAHYAHPW
ncbi:site-specific integrase [Lysinibacillus sp. FSL K6-0075]|uniref:site-specific integrase n=1 Tax=Lysinibacillus sp. FSL K6-0075 TaxID=2921415 RepID=UPI003158F63B